MDMAFRWDSEAECFEEEAAGGVTREQGAEVKKALLEISSSLEISIEILEDDLTMVKDSKFMNCVWLEWSELILSNEGLDIYNLIK